MTRWQVIFRGQVQGVGFRYTVFEIAKNFEVVGSVRNRFDGTVELVCEGESTEIDQFVQAILERRPGYVSDHEVEQHDSTGEFRNFEIRF